MRGRIPDKLTDFRVYNDAQDLLGVADIDLPDFEADSDEIKGELTNSPFFIIRQSPIRFSHHWKTA